MRRRQTYTAPGITVTFDPEICIHSAVCLRALPEVFDIRRRRWIAPEAAEAEKVRAAIDSCPSGALRYELEGQATAEAQVPATPAATTIRLSRNGPLLIEGDFEIVDEVGTPIDVAPRVALCRCGATANQPFCDGSHRRIGFQSRPGPGSAPE